MTAENVLKILTATKHLNRPLKQDNKRHYFNDRNSMVVKNIVRKFDEVEWSKKHVSLIG